MDTLGKVPPDTLGGCRQPFRAPVRMRAEPSSFRRGGCDPIWSDISVLPVTDLRSPSFSHG
jgi:hypothetical protein